MHQVFRDIYQVSNIYLATTTGFFILEMILIVFLFFTIICFLFIFVFIFLSIYHLLVSIRTEHKTSFFIFYLPPSVFVPTVCLLLRLFVSMSFYFLSTFFCLNSLPVLCFWVCLFVCLAATLLLSLYLLTVFTFIVSFDFVVQYLYLSIITHHLLLHFFIRPLGENSRYWVRAALSTPTRPLYE